MTIRSSAKPWRMHCLLSSCQPAKDSNSERDDQLCMMCVFWPSQVSFIPLTTWDEVAAAPAPDFSFGPKRFHMTCCRKQVCHISLLYMPCCYSMMLSDEDQGITQGEHVPHQYSLSHSAFDRQQCLQYLGSVPYEAASSHDLPILPYLHFSGASIKRYGQYFVTSCVMQAGGDIVHWQQCRPGDIFTRSLGCSDQD